MSTILDALRKVERERDPSSDALLDAPTVSSGSRRRRSFPFGAIVACAVLGFGGGAVLSWLLPASDSETQIAALPEPPPPPDIAVPRPPLRAKPAVPAAPVEDRPVAVAPPPAAPPPAAEVPPAAAPPPVAAAPGVAPPAPVEAPPAVAAGPAAAQPAPAVPPKVASADSGPALAAVERSKSALEPSPFGSARDTASAPAKDAKGVAKAIPAEARTVPERREPQDLAALAPAAPPEAELPTAEEAVVPDEPEPETSPESVVDTGRSPPGAPKVALSFLQWSVDPARRFAFISIDGAPSQRIREGEVAGGLTVAAITPTGVQFKREGTLFVIRPRH